MCQLRVNGLYDLDYAAIPIGWAVDVSILVKEHIPKDAAHKLVNSFLMGGPSTFNRHSTFQRRLSVNGSLLRRNARC